MGLAFLITSENLQLLSDRKVLKESEYAALLDASAVIGAARSEARRLVEQAQQQAGQMQEKAYADGMDKARRAHSEELLADAVKAERQLQAMRVAMANIVVRAVRQLIESADPDELLKASLRRIDALVRSESFISVRVAPSDEERARRALDELAADTGWASRVTLQRDASLAPRMCVVQTPSGSLQIGLDAQLAAIRRAVEQAAL